MTPTVFECRTKATSKEGNQLRWSVNWALARRARLVLTQAELICGDWHIPYGEFEDAVLVTIPTRFGEAMNLIVTWRRVVYQFQLKSQCLWRSVMDPFWDGPLPFPVRREVRHLHR